CSRSPSAPSTTPAKPAQTHPRQESASDATKPEDRPFAVDQAADVRKPAQRKFSRHPVPHYRGRAWPTWKQYGLPWARPAWQAHETHGAVELVTDSVGARILVRELGLPYRRVSCVLDRCNAHPGLWAYGKVLAYREHVELGQPFLHIDSDVYLWKPMPERI